MALCVLVALVPLAFAAPLFEPYLTIKQILVQTGAATVALLWLITARAGPLTLVLTPIWIPLVGLSLAGGLSVLWSSHPSASLEEGQRLFFGFLLFAVTLHQMKRSQTRTMLATALVLAGTIEAVYVLLQYSLGDPIFVTDSLPGKWRTFGTLGNPNWTGEFLAVVALISLGRLVDLGPNEPPLFDIKRGVSKSSSGGKSQSAQRWMLLALILILLALAATLARGTWLAFLVGAGAFTLVRRAHRGSRVASVPATWSRRWIWPLAVTAGIGAAALIVLPLLGNQEAINHLLNLKSVRGRVWMWAVTWTMIKDAPWGGHGLGTFGLHFPLYQAKVFSQEWAAPFVSNASFTSYAHNDYLQLWAEVGLLGLLAFGMLVWMVVKRGRALANDPVALGCWAALISLLVNAAVAFPLHLPTTLMLFAVLLGAVEGVGCKKTMALSLSAPPARIAILLLAVTLCFTAYRSSYHRVAADTALFRASAALGSHHWNEAEKAMRAAIHHAPARLDGYAILGRLHLERGEYERALTVLDQAMRLGFDTDVYDWKATALQRTGQRAAAIATLNELVWLRPDLQWPRQRLSALSRDDKNHEEDKQ
ncbi:MAG: O-antigen ligase family protein [Acidobacteria bacterium]|nr:O-antigen ligase family protein [Acidobacteriota bacterium]